MNLHLISLLFYIWRKKVYREGDLARSQDEIDTLHAAAQTNRSGSVRVDRSVLQTAHAAQFGIVADVHILDAAAVQNTYVVTDITVIGSMCLRVLVNHPLDLMNHLRTVTIQGEDIRQARTQFVEDRDLTTTAFVHHRHTHTVSERALSVHEDCIHVLDAGVVADMVVGDVVMDVVQVCVVTDLAVMQGGVVDTRMDLQTAR